MSDRRFPKADSPRPTPRKEPHMQFDITIRNRFFDTVHFEHVEASDIDEAIDVAFGLADRGLAIDVDVSDGCGTSASFSINDELEPVETKVLLFDRQRDTFVEVVVVARTAHDGVAKAVEGRLDAEVVAIDAGGETEWWMDASQTRLPQPWDFLKPRRHPSLRLVTGGAA